METSNKSKIAKAIIEVMKEVKGIEKSSTVGVGSGAYKGVPDREVKKIIGEAMQKNGLCILPIWSEAKTEISRWEESYQGQTKQKQSVFTEITAKYLLLHESGESIEVSGYGHGVDTQDKGAGKASTYALKNLLLYMFMVPTGKIDDADAHHSDEAPVAPKTPAAPQPTPAPGIKPELTEKMPAFGRAHKSISTGEKTLADIEKVYTVSDRVATLLTSKI